MPIILRGIMIYHTLNIISKLVLKVVTLVGKERQLWKYLLLNGKQSTISRINGHSNEREDSREKLCGKYFLN